MNELMEREPLETARGREERRCEERGKKDPRFFHAYKLHYGGRLILMSYTAHDNCRVGSRQRVDVCCNPKKLTLILGLNNNHSNVQSD